MLTATAALEHERAVLEDGAVESLSEQIDGIGIHRGAVDVKDVLAEGPASVASHEQRPALVARSARAGQWVPTGSIRRWLRGGEVGWRANRINAGWRTDTLVPAVEAALAEGFTGRGAEVALSTLGLHAASVGAAVDALDDVYAGRRSLPA